MNFPNNLLYTRNHEWVRMENNLAFVGMTDFKQNKLGKIISANIYSLGKVLSRGQEFADIQTAKVVSPLQMPLSGKVIAANFQLSINSSSVNNDPFGEGWLIIIDIIIDIKNPEEKKLLLTVNEYKKIVALPSISLVGKPFFHKMGDERMSGGSIPLMDTKARLAV